VLLIVEFVLLLSLSFIESRFLITLPTCQMGPVSVHNTARGMNHISDRTLTDVLAVIKPIVPALADKTTPGDTCYFEFGIFLQLECTDLWGSRFNAEIEYVISLENYARP
jgi:hypothetical protein